LIGNIAKIPWNVNFLTFYHFFLDIEQFGPYISGHYFDPVMMKNNRLKKFNSLYDGVLRLPRLAIILVLINLLLILGLITG